MADLAEKSCTACAEWVPPLTPETLRALQSRLDSDWVVDTTAQTLCRDFAFKGFAKAVFMANLAAVISDQQGHHADIAFGWGYCRITVTSHETGHLSENDFIWAAKLDSALRG